MSSRFPFTGLVHDWSNNDVHDFDHEDHAEEGEGVDGGVCLHDGPVGGDGGGGGQARRGGHAAGDDAGESK